MINILMIVALIILGFNVFLWFSWSREISLSNSSGVAMAPPINNKKERNQKRPTRRKSKGKKIRETLNQDISDDEMDLDFELGGEDFDLGSFGNIQREDEFSDGDLDNTSSDDDILTEEFGDLEVNEVTKKKGKLKKQSLEEEFSEIFQDDSSDVFGSNNSDIPEVESNKSHFFVDKGNDFLNFNDGKESEPEEDLSFLKDYDFSGKERGAIKNKVEEDDSDMLGMEDFSDYDLKELDRLAKEAIKKEKEVELKKDPVNKKKGETKSDESLSGGEDIMDRLTRLSDKMK